MMTEHRVVVAELIRTGGFAGRRMRARVDSDHLPAPEAQRLAALVDEVDFDALTPPAPPPRGAADMVRYDITVRRGGRTWHADLVDSQVPATMRPLLQYLTAAARAEP